MTQLRFHHLKMEIQDKNGNIEMIPYCNIEYLIYDKPYIFLIYREDKKKKKILLQSSLSYMELNLPIVFFRCNPTSILNLCYFKEYNYSEKQISIEDGKRFTISRRRYREFQKRITSLPRLSPLCNACLLCTNACPIKDSFCATQKNDRIASEIDQTV